MVKSATLRLAVITAALFCAVALAFTACGKGKQPTGSGGLQAADSMGSMESAPPDELSLDDALSELNALVCPEGVDAALWQQLKSAFTDALTARGEAKMVSTPPTGEANRVDDLGISDNGDGTYTLAWHYRNLGDYSQNGTVAIADITPLAQHFGETYDPETEPHCIQAVIDGSGNGKVDIADVTPIAVNFQRDVQRYVIEGAESAEGPWAAVGEVAQSAGSGEGRLEYSAIIQSPAALWHRVVAFDAEGNPGDPSNAALRPSNEPIIYSVSPTSGYQHEEYTFTATVTGQEPLSYAWDFGGGAEPNVSSAPSPTVTLSDAGEYEASLTVTNAYGSADYPFTLTVSERDTWAHTWGGGSSESAVDVAVDGEGNVYVLGYTESFGAGSSDVLVLKYSPDGVLQWARTWGGEITDHPVGIAILSDGDIVAGGYTKNFGAGMDDIFILKYDPDGNLLMQKTWGTPDYERVNDMAVDEDGGIYFTGYRTVYGGQADAMTMKLDSNGQVLWARAWDTGTDERGYGLAIDDGGVYVALSVETGAEDTDVSLIKYSGSGNVEWVRGWGGDGDDGIGNLMLSKDGTITLSGSTTSFGEGGSDLLLLKVTPDGFVVRALTWGTSGNEGGGALEGDGNGRLSLIAGKQVEGNWRGLIALVDEEWAAILAMSVKRDWELLQSLGLDSDGNLYSVGGASDNSVTWEEVFGVTSEPVGLEYDLSEWSDSQLEGTETDANGQISEPNGIQDIGGGGGADILIVKNIPR